MRRAMLHLLFVLGFTPNLVLGCHRKPVRRDMYDPAGYYSLTQEATRSCPDLKEANTVDDSQVYSDYNAEEDDSTCVNLPPGLERFGSGYVTGFHSFGNRQRGKVFNLTCNNATRKWGAYTIPNEVNYILSSTMGSFASHKVDGISLLELFGNDGLFNDVDGKFIGELEKRSWNSFRDSPTAEYTSGKVHFYECGLGEKATPTAAMLQVYDGLPNDALYYNSARSRKDYYRFISRFGSHVLKSVTFGGKYFSVRDDKEKSGKEPTVLITDGLTHHFNNTSGVRSPPDWENAVKASPVPIVATSIPIAEFIEDRRIRARAVGPWSFWTPSARSEIKIRNFKEATELEGKSQSLRKLSYELDALKLNHSLAHFLIEKLREELPFICPSGNLYDMVDKWIRKENNMKLDKFGIVCTDNEWFSPEENQYLVYTLQFRLIPGLCFTRYQKFSACNAKKIRSPSPNNRVCMRFYKGHRCEGEPMKVIDSRWSLGEFEDAMVKATSFSFC